MLCRMVGLRPAGFGIFIGLLMFEALIAITVGLCVSAAVPTVGTYSTLLYTCVEITDCIVFSLNFTNTAHPSSLTHWPMQKQQMLSDLP